MHARLDSWSGDPSMDQGVEDECQREDKESADSRLSQGKEDTILLEKTQQKIWIWAREMSNLVFQRRFPYT